MKIDQQIGFSTILFDSLFGLILFFSLDSFLDIKGFYQFIFYLFSAIIVIHWWLVFKSADDAFREEVDDSAIDLVFGIVYIIFLEFIVLMSRDFNLVKATYYLLALLALDLVWALAWRYLGQWHTTDTKKIKKMEIELNYNIGINIIAIILFALLIIVNSIISIPFYLTLFIVLYIIYIILTFRTKIIDLKIF